MRRARGVPSRDASSSAGGAVQLLEVVERRSTTNKPRVRGSGAGRAGRFASGAGTEEATVGVCQNRPSHWDPRGTRSREGSSHERHTAGPGAPRKNNTSTCTSATPSIPRRQSLIIIIDCLSHLPPARVVCSRRRATGRALDQFLSRVQGAGVRAWPPSHPPSPVCCCVWPGRPARAHAASSRRHPRLSQSCSRPHVTAP